MRFKFSNKGMLFLRVGSANAQRQHNSKERRKGRKHLAPVGRGIWAFPFTIDDAFFYIHKLNAVFPKEHNECGTYDGDDEGQRAAKLKKKAMKIVGRRKICSCCGRRQCTVQNGTRP